MAVEKPEECLAKFSVHETVRDGIAATRDIGQQLHQTNAGATDDRVYQFGREKVPRIDHVQRRPAYEELEDYDEEHPDHLQHHRGNERGLGWGCFWPRGIIFKDERGIVSRRAVSRIEHNSPFSNQSPVYMRDCKSFYVQIYGKLLWKLLWSVFAK